MKRYSATFSEFCFCQNSIRLPTSFAWQKHHQSLQERDQRGFLQLSIINYRLLYQIRRFTVINNRLWDQIGRFWNYQLSMTGYEIKNRMFFAIITYRLWDQIWYLLQLLLKTLPPNVPTYWNPCSVRRLCSWTKIL